MAGGKCPGLPRIRDQIGVARGCEDDFEHFE